MATEFSTAGQDLLDAANDSWRERRREYAGLAFSISVAQAVRQDVAENGREGKKRKARREEAVKTVTALFDHTRDQEAARLDRVSMQAQAFGSGAAFSAAGDDLREFASEVVGLLEGMEAAGFGVRTFGIIDPSFIISLIMAIIDAIKKCKELKPVPVPV